MRPPRRILNRNQVHRLAAEHLQVAPEVQGLQRKTSAQVLWSLLLAAAARITSLSDACQRFLDAPSDERCARRSSHPARLRHAATAAQRRPGRAPAQGPAQRASSGWPST